MALRWVLCDYGEVLSAPQSPASVASLAELAGMEVDDLTDRYWAHRQAYDRGDLTAADYWAAVLGRPAGSALDELIATDVAGWLGLVPESVAAALDLGLAPAVLSNAPLEVAAGIDALPALAPFEPRMFSCHLRLAKPEPAIYAAALDRLGATAAEVVFVDDRPANVAAAAAVGIAAVRYEGLASWSAVRAVFS